MKFDIHYTMKGPGGTIQAPNKTNPVEAESIHDVLRQLSERLPSFFGVECIGVSIKEHVPETDPTRQHVEQ